MMIPAQMVVGFQRDRALACSPWIEDHRLRNRMRVLVRFSTGALLALLAVPFLAPSRARAGCDYPTHVERMSPSQSNLGALTQPRSPFPVRSSKPCPCSGPTCDRRPFVPVAPTTVEIVKIQDWACPLRLELASSPRFSAWAIELQSPRPMRRASSIFHPPRPFTDRASL